MKRIIPLVVAALAAWTSPARAEPVTIGWGAFPDVAAIAEAQDKGLWKDQDLQAQIIPFATGRDGFEALIGGQVDFAIMAEFPAVTGAMRNLKFSIPAVLSQYKSFRAIAKSPTPLTLKDLAGKKVAMPLGTNVHFIIADALKAAGVTAELVNVSPPDMIPSLVRGDVDAIATFPNGYGGAKRALAAQYQEIPLTGYESSFVLVASEKATANPDFIKRVLAVLLKGDELVFKDPAEAQQAVSRYVGKALTLEAIQASWGDYDQHIKLDRGTLDLMVREGTWLRDQGFVKQGTPSVELYRKVFLPGPLKALTPASVEIE